MISYDMRDMMRTWTLFETSLVKCTASLDTVVTGVGVHHGAGRGDLGVRGDRGHEAGG